MLIRPKMLTDIGMITLGVLDHLGKSLDDLVFS